MKVIYYYHIPKCGGTFVYRNMGHLAHQLDNSAIYDFTNKTRADGFIATDTNRKKLKDFLESIPTLKYDYVFVHQHHRYCGLKELLPDLKECSNKLNANGDELYVFTVVREPVSYITSYVNFTRNNKYISYAGQHSKGGFDTLPYTNMQSKYLLHNLRFRIEEYSVNKDDVIEVLNFLNKAYTTENLKELESDLRNLINDDIEWDKSKANITKKKIPPTEEQKAQLLKKNDIDVWLYNYIKGSAEE